MLLLSFAGVVSSFGSQRARRSSAWAIGIAVALAAGPRALPRLQATWSAARDSVHVGGSWLPLALILLLFAVKYTAGVSLALHPALVGDAAFVSTCSFFFGALSGLFAARGWQLWQRREAAFA